jgi:hypothetical protein
MTHSPADPDREIAQRRLAAALEQLPRDAATDIERRRLAAAGGAPASRKLQMAAEMSQTTSIVMEGLRDD